MSQDNSLVRSNKLAESLLEVTTLEIKTMVVETISVESFHPWQVYQEIYQLSPSLLQQQGISKSLSDRYLQLRQQLAYEYSLVTRIRELPGPEELVNSSLFEENPRFVAKLRQLGINKHILDQHHAIYAQTILELEGNITNRYNQTLLNHPQRDIILSLHSQGVNAATQQWQRIIKLITKILC